MDGFYTIAEVCRLLHVSRETLRNRLEDSIAGGVERTRGPVRFSRPRGQKVLTAALPEALAHEVLEKGVELSVAIDKFAGEAGIRDAQASAAKAECVHSSYSNLRTK